MITKCQCHVVKAQTKSSCTYDMTQEDLLCDMCRNATCIDLEGVTRSDGSRTLGPDHAWYGKYIQAKFQAWAFERENH